jgi:O-antigen/teichoic acid export membrane protein
LGTAKNIVFSSLQSIVTILFPLITFPYASRVLGPDGIGITNFAESFCRYFMLFAALGIPVYAVREISKVSKDKDKITKFFFEIFTINLITSSFVVGIYLLIISFFNKFDNYHELYVLGAFYIFINTFSIEWFYNGLSEFKYLAIRTLIVRIVSLVCLFLMVRTKDDVLWFFGLNVLVLLVNNILNFVYLKDKIHFSWQVLNLSKHLRPLMIIFFSSLAISLYSLLDTIILGFLKEDYFVGLYTLANKINKIPTTFILAVGAVFLPKLVMAYQDNDKKDFENLVQKSMQFIVVFSVPICFFILLSSKTLIILLAGNSFIEADWSLQLMTPLTFLIGFSYFFGMQVLLVVGEEKKLLLSVITGTILSIVLNFILIPIFADRGAAIANIVCETFVTILTGYFASKHIDFGNIFKIFFIQVFIYCAVALILFFFSPFNISLGLKFFIQVLFFIITFIIINLYILKIPFVSIFFKSLQEKINL